MQLSSSNKTITHKQKIVQSSNVVKMLPICAIDDEIQSHESKGQGHKISLTTVY